jgi:hypothetical protein
MNNSLAFSDNWRRVLILTKESSMDVDVPVAYVSLNEKKLPNRLRAFCEKYWEQFEFDYDIYSYLLWPLHDKVSAESLAQQLNTKFAKCAKVVLMPPVLAHDLKFDDEGGSLEFE